MHISFNWGGVSKNFFINKLISWYNKQVYKNIYSFKTLNIFHILNILCLYWLPNSALCSNLAANYVGGKSHVSNIFFYFNIISNKHSLFDFPNVSWSNCMCTNWNGCSLHMHAPNWLKLFAINSNVHLHFMCSNLFDRSTLYMTLWIFDNLFFGYNLWVLNFFANVTLIFFNFNLSLFSDFYSFWSCF